MRAPPLFLLLLVVSTLSASERRDIWDWTLDERLAARVETLKAQPKWRLDGSTHPELFTPTELFEGLIDSCFAIGGDEYRAACQRRTADAAKRHGLPDSFIRDLEENAADYIDLLRRQYAGENVAESLCAARAAALQRVRARVGAAALHRFLYIVEAPSHNQIGVTPFDAEKTVTRLRDQERGCSK